MFIEAAVTVDAVIIRGMQKIVEYIRYDAPAGDADVIWYSRQADCEWVEKFVVAKSKLKAYGRDGGRVDLGRGLFTLEKVKAGEVIAFYFGENLGRCTKHLFFYYFLLKVKLKRTSAKTKFFFI